MGLEAVIFDLDGVLVTTSELHYRAWGRLAEDHNAPFDREFNERFKGVSRFDCVRILFPSVKDDGFLERMAEIKNSYYLELIDNLSHGDLFPGVEQFIEDLKSDGIKAAVGSVSKNTHAVLEKLGIHNIFDAIVDGNDVEHSKPEPDVFLRSAERMNVCRENCIVVEDAAAGIQAAHSAGMLAVGVGSGDTLSEAEYIVDCVSRITVHGLKTLYAKMCSKRV